MKTEVKGCSVQEMSCPSLLAVLCYPPFAAVLCQKLPATGFSGVLQGVGRLQSNSSHALKSDK